MHSLKTVTGICQCLSRSSLKAAADIKQECRWFLSRTRYQGGWKQKRWLEMQLRFSFEGEWASASSSWAPDGDGWTCYLQSVYRGVIESSDVYQAKRNGLFMLSCPFSTDERMAGAIKDGEPQGVKPIWSVPGHVVVATMVMLFLQLASYFGLCNH